MEFTYDEARSKLKNSSHLWEDNLRQIEQVIPVSDIVIAYPICVHNDNTKEERLTFFSSKAIFDLRFENGKAYKLVAFKSKDIIKISLDMHENKKATLHIQFPDEEIEIASLDSIYKNRTFEIVEVIIKIAGMYTR